MLARSVSPIVWLDLDSCVMVDVVVVSLVDLLVVTVIPIAVTVDRLAVVVIVIVLFGDRAICRTLNPVSFQVLLHHQHQLFIIDNSQIKLNVIKTRISVMCCVCVVRPSYFVSPKARRTSWNNTEIQQNCRLPTVGCFVSTDHRLHCLTAVLFQTSAHPEIELKQNTETVLGLFQLHKHIWKIC